MTGLDRQAPSPTPRNTSILICCHGDPSWEEAAWSHAYPSAVAADQGAVETTVVYDRGATLAEVRNLGAVHARGQWLCFLDADDELAPGFIDEMHRAWLILAHGDGIPHPGYPGSTDFLFAPAVSYQSESGASSLPAIPNKGRWPDMNECVIGTLVERELFLKVGGFRDLPSLEDYDLWLRCVKAGALIRHVPEAVYRASIRPGSRNSDQSVYHELRAEHAAVWLTPP